MADEKDTKISGEPTKDANVVNSATKPVENQPPKVELDHGEPSDEHKALADAKDADKADPWGTTPVQMRDDHDPSVDPATNDPIRGGADQGAGSYGYAGPPNAMEPGQDTDIEGGTNAPA